MWQVLSLRYRIRVDGMEKLAALKGQKSILFLPNHTSQIDALFIFFTLRRMFRVRPIVVEYVYRMRFLNPLMRWFKACPVPNFDSAVNEFKKEEMQKCFGAILNDLKRGDHFLLYPAARMKLTSREEVGGSSGCFNLVKECPETNIVLIRLSGMWGSSFSRAVDGKIPSLAQNLKNAGQILLKNFLFFTPRRKVLIEIEPLSLKAKQIESKVEFNRFLEEWYNQYPDGEGKRRSEEPLQQVSYSFWHRALPPLSLPAEQKKPIDCAEIPREIEGAIYAEIRRILKDPDHKISKEMLLSSDLGLDSLEIADLFAFLTSSFDTAEDFPEEMRSVQDLLLFAAGAAKQDPHALDRKNHQWLDEPGRPEVTLPKGKTLPEAFLSIYRRMKTFEAYGDDFLGVLSYRKMALAIFGLALSFKKEKEKTIGILLPSSASAYLLVFALLFAGKTPVMLNWTLGSRYLDHMMEIAKIEKVISSWNFLERLQGVDLGTVVHRLEYLEDIRKKISWKIKIQSLLLSYLPQKALSHFFRLKTIDENDPAIILFTSGTEATPKGVPLSHKNILHSAHAVGSRMQFYSEDVIYNSLPPFHSLGFSVLGIAPTLMGLRVAFYPNPKDVNALIEGIVRWKVTVFCSAPSFIKNLLAANLSKQMHKIRMFVTGAEKTPPDLYRQVEMATPKAQLIESYGITECSPSISLGKFNHPQKGVGCLLPGIEACTVNPETKELLPPGAEGELCYHGPNVFSGYLQNVCNPFIAINGKNWFLSGDLGSIDSENNVILSGRLKQFVKIGGEMISFRAIENAIFQHLLDCARISHDRPPSLVVIGKEGVSGKFELILFSSIPLEKEEVLEILKKGGFSPLVKISLVRQVAEIPLMGSGKVDYKRLYEMG